MMRRILLVGIVGLLGCTTSADVPPAPKPPVVTVAPALTQTTRDYDEYVGRTEASETVEVRARVSGVLQEVLFLEGGTVDQGQDLFTIEKEQYEAVYAQSQSRVNLYSANLGLAESGFARAQQLFPQGAIAKEEFDEKAAAVEVAKAQIESAEKDKELAGLDVKYTTVKSPIEGRIDRAFVTPGNMLTGGLGSGTLLTRIVKDQPIYAYVDVDERSILRYLRKTRAEKPKAGPEVTSLRDLNIQCELQLQDETGYPHVGILDFAENRVDASTGTIRIRGEFLNEDQLLRGGLFVRVRVPTSEPYDAVLIPEQAIGSDQGEKFAYVIDSADKAERRVLELGGSQGSLRIVKLGIVAGERVVVKGIQRLQPGMQVVPKDEPTNNAAAKAADSTKNSLQ